MKKKMTLLSIVFMTSTFLGCSGGASESENLKRQWISSGAELSVPESVVYDDQKQALYVSNVNSQSSGNPWEDNGGFISKLNRDGKVIELKWITGLKAPKGLTVNGEHLYAADLNGVVDINTTSGKIIQRWDAPTGVQMLNDITFDGANNCLYISDSGTKEIYTVTPDGAFSLLYAKESSLKPEQNGLLMESNSLIMQGTVGYLKSFNPTDTQKVTIISDSVGIAIDGITKYEDKGYLISTWGGEIHFVDHQGVSKLLLDSKPNRTADIAYISELGLLLVPNFDKNIVAYTVRGL